MGSDATPLWADGAQLIPVALAYCWFAVTSIILTRIDVRTHRLPDRIVLPGYVVAVACFGIAALLGGTWRRLLDALIGLAALLVFYAVLRLISRSGIGGGDVKLAGVVGVHLGWLGLTPLLIGAICAFLLGGAYATILLVSRRATRRTRIPFGPFMLAGAWIAIVLDVVLALRAAG